MRILIFDIVSSGHHSIYIREIANLYAGEGFEVTIVAPPLQIDLIDESNRIRVEEIEVSALSTLMRSAPMVRAFRVWLLLRRYLLSGGCEHDVVLLPYADYIVPAIALLGRPILAAKLVAICMRQNFHHYAEGLAKQPQRGRFLRALAFDAFASRCVHVLTIDPLLKRHVRSKNVAYLADPAGAACSSERCDKPTARTRLGIPLDRFVVLVYGSLDERKGVDTLLHSVRQLADEKITICLIGLQSAAVAVAVSKNKSYLDLRVVEGFVDRSIVDDFMAASDYVWLGYKGHLGMSGVLVEAVRAGVRVIGCEEGLIGWYVKNLGLGPTADVGREEAVIEALRYARKNTTPLSESQMNAFQDHTWPVAAVSLKRCLQVPR